MIVDSRLSNQCLYRSAEEANMNRRFNRNDSPGEARGVRNEDIWHSVWKRIEGSSRDATPTGKSKLALEPPRDYVADSDIHGSERRA
jgi:hypothetical protein